MIYRYDHSINESDIWDLGECSLVDEYSDRRQAHKNLKREIKKFFDVKFFCISSFSNPDFRDPYAKLWHQDDWGEDQYVAIWASHDGTELKRPNGKAVYKCKPQHIYLFSNTKWLHRQPYFTRKNRVVTRGWIKPQS